MGYVDGMEWIALVLPAWREFIKGPGFPPLEVSGPLAVLWMESKVALVGETGELNVIENGMWATYRLEPK